MPNYEFTEAEKERRKMLADNIRSFADDIEQGKDDISITLYNYHLREGGYYYPEKLRYTGNSLVIHRGKGGFPNNMALLGRLFEESDGKMESHWRFAD